MAVNNAVAGGNQITSWANGWEVRDVWDTLTKLDTSRNTPFDQLLRASSRMRRAKNVKVEYYRRDAVIPSSSLVASDSAGASAGATQTITVANAQVFLVGEMVQYQNAAGAKYVGIITAVNYGTNAVTVGTLNLAADASNIRSANAFGAGAVAKAATPLLRIAQARAERDAPPDTNRNLPQASFNLVQSFATLIDESTHAKKSSNYTQAESEVYRQEKRESHRRDINKALYIGRKGVTLRGGKYVWTFDGLQAHNLPQFGYSAGNLTESQLIDLSFAVGTGNAGSESRIVLCGKDVAKDMTKVMTLKMQHNENRTIAGMKMRGIATDAGTIMKIHDPTLDDLGMSNKAFVVDPAFMGRAEMETYNETHIDGRKNGTFDGDGEWGNEMFCPIFTMPEAFMEITAN